MKLTDFTSKPLEEALKDMELMNFKIHTNDYGEIQYVELKYTSKDFVRDTSTNKRLFKNSTMEDY